MDELNEQERELLVAYLQEEYEKNPDTFQIPKEKLQELINAQLNMRDENQAQEEDEQDEDEGEQDDDEVKEVSLDEQQQQQMMLI